MTGVAPSVLVVASRPNAGTAAFVPRIASATASAAAAGGAGLFALKANRPLMLAELERVFADPASPVLTHTTTDIERGRIETCRHAVCRDVTLLFSDRRYPDAPALPGLATIAMVEAEVEQTVRIRRSRRFSLSSAALSPERFAAAARAPRHIETSLHWLLGDRRSAKGHTSFDEDRARNRKDRGPASRAILRKFALDPVPHRAGAMGPRLLRAARPDITIRRKRSRSSNHFARAILGQMR
jgi:predicted transposase YbfD/YdcC